MTKMNSNVKGILFLMLAINVMWGLVLWHEIPTWMTLAGALLTLSSGVYILYRDQKERSENGAKRIEKQSQPDTYEIYQR